MTDADRKSTHQRPTHCETRADIFAKKTFSFKTKGEPHVLCRFRVEVK